MQDNLGALVEWTSNLQEKEDEEIEVLSNLFTNVLLVEMGLKSCDYYCYKLALGVLKFFP